MQKIICDYDGCEKEVCSEDMTLTPPTMRFCKEHSEQFDALVKNKDIPGMLSFHVKSLGGAEKAAQGHRLSSRTPHAQDQASACPKCGRE